MTARNGTAAPGGGIFAYFDSARHRVIVTYKGVPSIGTIQPNTLQVAIYESGKIEMIVGALAQTGTAYSPGILGTIGIATGETKARDLRRATPMNVSSLRNNAPVYIGFGSAGAIYDQYYVGTGTSCRSDDGDLQQDGET